MINERYAKALFNLANKQNKLQPWLDTLLSLQEFMRENPKLYEYLTSPLPSTQKQEALFIKLFKPYFDPEPLHFFQILMRKRRFSGFHCIINTFKKLAFEKMGLLEGLITTPTPLNDHYKEALSLEWGKFFNKKIVLNEALDPSLIGGGILAFDNKRIDFSLKGKLQKLQNNLSRNERS